MKKKVITQLAISCANSDKLSKKVIDFVLFNLTKGELKFFLREYKTAISKKRVYITASSSLNKETMSFLKSMYKNFGLEVNYDKTLGAGIKIQQNDMIMDFTFKKYLEDTIEKLKI